MKRNSDLVLWALVLVCNQLS